VRVAGIDQLEQAAVQVIEEALLCSDIHLSVELDVRGIGIVEQDDAAIIGDEPAGASGVAEGLAVLAVETRVVGDRVAGFGGVWYGSHALTFRGWSG
jgi:hypothetical protein